METIWTVVGIGAILVVVVIVGWLVGIYNSLVRLKNNIKKAWSNIDVLLKQRHDELTKLMNTVKGYMKHEEGVLTKITQARTAFMDAQSVGDKVKADNMMTSTLKSLFAVAENYPELKADRSFAQFQSRISEIENQIADRREFYNDSVNTFNIRIEQIPDLFVARMLGYAARELFQADESDRADVEVQF